MSDSKDLDGAVRATSIDFDRTYGTSSSGRSAQAPLHHGNAEVIETSPDRAEEEKTKRSWRTKLAYFKTWDFWFILILGQILAICITGTNTLSTLLAEAGTSIPAFQSLFNYVLLNIVYTGWTIYQYGFRKWTQLIWRDGWKCMSFLLSFSLPLTPR